MADSISTGRRDFSRSGVPSTRLVVRRLGRRLGGSSGRGSRFRPLVARGSGVVHKCHGALGRGVRSSVLCPADFELHGGVVCGQLHSNILPSQPRRHSITSPQLHRSTHSQMDGVASSGVGSTVHYGAQQCSSRFPFQTQSNLRVGMDSEDRGLSGSSQEVASFRRSLRHISKSPMLSIFFSVPRSERYGHRCSAPEWEWVAGVCLSSLGSHSCSTEEAPVVLWSPPDHHHSVLVSETVVDGPIPLPLSRDLLRQPHFHRHHLGVSGLSLHAWRLSSDLPGLRVSLRM